MADRLRPSGGVLYVTYDGLLEPLGSAQVLPYIHGLARMGFNISVLSFEKPTDLADVERVAQVQTALARGGVSWEWLKYHRAPTLAATAYDVGKAARRIRRLRPALVHARSYIPAFMAARGLTGLTGKILFDMRGFWIDERIETQGWNPRGLKVRRARRTEARLLRRADHILHLTHAGCARVRSRFPDVPEERHTVVSTSADLRQFTVPKDVVSERRALGLPLEGPLLVHSGNLGDHRYQADRTMEIGKAFTSATGGTFLVLTKDVEEAAARAESAGVPAIVRSLPYPEMPRWLRVADAGLAMVRIGPSTVASAPTKVGEYLASGLAVAASPCGDLSDQFAQAKHSFVAGEDERVQDIAARLAHAARGSGRKDEGRALAERHYSLDRALDGLATAYDRLEVRPCA